MIYIALRVMCSELTMGQFW